MKGTSPDKLDNEASTVRVNEEHSVGDIIHSWGTPSLNPEILFHRSN